jgi:hypothetical protein
MALLQPSLLVPLFWLSGDRGDTYTHTDSKMILQTSFYFFQNTESRLNITEAKASQFGECET